MIIRLAALKNVNIICSWPTIRTQLVYLIGVVLQKSENIRRLEKSRSFVIFKVALAFSPYSSRLHRLTPVLRTKRQNKIVNSIQYKVNSTNKKYRVGWGSNRDPGVDPNRATGSCTCTGGDISAWDQEFSF